MGFPGDWPVGCPPADAVAAEGTVFRIAKTDPPGPDDFKSYRELGISRGDPCRCCGVSVYRLLSDAEHASRTFRNMGKVIAKAVLQADDGMAKPTGKPTHTTWWPYEEVDRTARFAVVGKVP